jgi:hypothetical protein
VRRLRRWTAASWALPGGPARTRAEVVAAAVQRIADLAADAEAQPRRAVPRLADTVLADQLAVVADDVLRAGDPAAVRRLATELPALRSALGFPGR